MDLPDWIRGRAVVWAAVAPGREHGGDVNLSATIRAVLIEDSLGDG
jgi:hypothetical protein